MHTKLIFSLSTVNQEVYFALGGWLSSFESSSWATLLEEGMIAESFQVSSITTPSVFFPTGVIIDYYSPFFRKRVDPNVVMTEVKHKVFFSCPFLSPKGS